MPNQAKGYWRKKSRRPVTSLRHGECEPSAPTTKSHSRRCAAPSWVKVTVGRSASMPSTTTSAHPEPQVAAVGKALRDEVDEHLVLRVDHHRTAAGQPGEVDPVQAALEGQVDPVVHAALAGHPGADAGVAQQIGRALLQDARADRLLDRGAALHVQHHGRDAAQVQQVREQEPGRARPDDPDLGAHGRSLSPGH